MRSREVRGSILRGGRETAMRTGSSTETSSPGGKIVSTQRRRSQSPCPMTRIAARASTPNKPYASEAEIISTFAEIGPQKRYVRAMSRITPRLDSGPRPRLLDTPL
jgi:hypothetical protein